MNNEHLAAQRDIKNPRELKPPGGGAGANASHDQDTTHDLSHSDSASPKKIFVCSPYRPLAETEESRKVELESNIHRAKTACRILTTLGFMPLAPHIYFTTFLKDEEKRERENGIRLGLQWLEEADEVWVFGDTISEGMAVEIARARARGLFQFYGASRTGRYSGRNIQLQNLPQNHISTLEQARDLVKMGCFDMVESIYGNTPDVLSQLIRTMLVPKEGCEFIVADFSAIEARVLAWEAEEQWVLDAFENGEDLYCATASQMFHVPVVKHGVNGELRQKGKIATLACGYGGSSGALISMGALQMGLKEEELPEIIDSWREANPKIVQYWWDVEKAAMTAYKTGERSEIGKIAFEFWSGTLWMVLPSGRRLAYLKPRTQPNRFGRMSLTYEGVGQNHKWSRQETYSGRLVENATQAIARDILAEAMARMEDYGLSIVGHVHDEVIIEAPIGKYKVDEVCKLMAIKPDWCEGLPLSAAGYLAPSYYFNNMKTGRNLQEVLVELNRQNKAKQDFISPAQGMRLREDGRTFEINHLTSNQQEVFGTTPLFHRQVASALGIPAKYYDLMQAQKPTLLAENVNAWFGDKTNSYMVRSMDYGAGQVARALLSERYRRIDNMEIASAVLPLFAGSDQYEVMSCEVTENRLYLKVVNHRLEMEVRKGDIVQAGVMISNSEVGLGAVSIQPLVYRLVCTNGMVVNDMGERRHHVGRQAKAVEDSFALYSDETMEAEDKAFLLKLRDTTMAAIEC